MDIIPFKTSFLFDSNYDYGESKNLTVNQGGTSSGKTYSILQVLFCKAFEEPGSVTTVVGQDVPNLKSGAIRDSKTIVSSSETVQSWILKYNKSDRIYYFKNGSIIEFNSYDDAQDAKNGKRDRAFFNEANGITYDIFVEIFQRTKDHTWIDFNPTHEFWVHEESILKRAKTRYIKSTFRHNPFIDKNTRAKILAYEPTDENIKDGTADEYLWDVYGKGEMGKLEGVLFPKEHLNFYDPNSIDAMKESEYSTGYVDTADTGEDDHCAIVGENIGSKIFIPELVYTKEEVEINVDKTGELLSKYGPEFCQVEINFGGTMYPLLLRPKLKKSKRNARTTMILPVRSKIHKHTRILSATSFIKKYVYFRADYETIPEYKAFMKNLTSYLKNGKSKHDDAPDALTGLVNYVIRTLNHLYDE